MKIVVYSLLVVALSTGCAYQTQNSSSAQSSNLQIKTSGRSTSEALYAGEIIGYAQVNPELTGYVPKIYDLFRSKGLNLSSKNPNAPLQLRTELILNNQEASLTITLNKLKKGNEYSLPSFEGGAWVPQRNESTIAVSYARIDNPPVNYDKKLVVAQLVNSALIDFTEQLNKSKPGSLRAIPL
jgi:hypothetical protein